jgi:hypothetical protein
MTDTPTFTETDAIAAVSKARDLVGRKYKTAIHNAWMSGDYHGEGLHELDSELQRARNTFGPSWLVRLRLK